MGGRDRPTGTEIQPQTHVPTHTNTRRTIREREGHLMRPQQGGGVAAEADTQTLGQMDRRQSTGSHGTYSEGSTAQHWVGKAPAGEGWGDWDGQIDGQSSISRPDSPTPMPRPHLHLYLRVSVSVSLSFSLCKPQLFGAPKRKMGKEDRDERKGRGTMCVRACVRACVRVCPAQGLVGILGGREEMKGAEDEQRDQQQHGTAAWKDEEHARAPNTAHVTHTLHTLEVPLVEGRSMKPWRKEGREGAEKEPAQGA